MTLSLFGSSTAPYMGWDFFADSPWPAAGPGLDPDGLAYYQREAVEAVMSKLENGESALAVLATGLGKSQPLSAKVLTPRGWTTMGAIVPGSTVVGRDGDPVKVLATYPQGRLEVYRIRFSDDTETRCSADHLWAVQTKSQKHRTREFVTRTARELMGDLRDGSGAAKWFVPVVGPVDFDEVSLPLDPYLLGVLLGDGCLRQGVYFTSADPHIVGRVASLGYVVKPLHACRPYDYVIMQGYHGPKGGPVTNALKRLGVWGKLAHEKRVPSTYITGSIHQRVELLRGIMDTDGYMAGGTAELTTTSLGLAEDVAEIVRSLGGVTRIRVRSTASGRPAYRLRVNTPINPFSLPRKADQYRADCRAVRSKSIASIEPCGYEECQCILIDSPDHLYVTDDYIVTHNTQILCIVAKEWVRRHGGSVLVLAHREELVYQARNRLEQLTGSMVDIEKCEWWADDKSTYVVGSVQSFNPNRLERLGKKRFNLVIIDEAHHAPAKTFKRALKFFDAKILGVTATPDRADEKALGQLFDEVAYCMDIEEGIDAGYLVPIKGYSCVIEDIDLSGVEYDKKKKDLAEGQLDEAMVKAGEGIVNETLRLYPDRSALVFAPGIKTAEYLVEKFNSAIPGSAMFIHAKTPPEDRKRLVADFKAGRYKYFVNVGIATEGFDAPDVSLVVMARPTCSRALYAQMAGRGTRAPGGVFAIIGKDQAAARRLLIANSSKPDCVILDMVGNSGKHSLVTTEDILGGNYSEDEVKAARKLKDKTPGSDAQQNLKLARQQLAAIAASAKAKVRSKVAAFDPFACYNLEMSDEQRYAVRFGHKAMSLGQQTALERMGLPPEQLKDLSYKAARSLLDEWNRRIKAGLSTMKQCAFFAKFGVDAREASKLRCQEAHDYLKRTGYGRQTDFNEVNRILFEARQPGEEA